MPSKKAVRVLSKKALGISVFVECIGCFAILGGFLEGISGGFLEGISGVFLEGCVCLLRNISFWVPRNNFLEGCG